MKGKIIKLNDFSAFRRRKNCNKYIIYSYVNQKRSSLKEKVLGG